MEAWLDEHRHELEELEPVEGKKAKVRCLVTGHEVLRDLDALKAHWAGRAFRAKQKAKLASERRAQANLNEYYPHIKPHKFNESMAFCHITKSMLHREKEALDKHVNGRRFKSAMARLPEHRRGFYAPGSERDLAARRRGGKAEAEAALEEDGPADDEAAAADDDESPEALLAEMEALVGRGDADATVGSQFEGAVAAAKARAEARKQGDGAKGASDGAADGVMPAGLAMFDGGTEMARDLSFSVVPSEWTAKPETDETLNRFDDDSSDDEEQEEGGQQGEEEEKTKKVVSKGNKAKGTKRKAETNTEPKAKKPRRGKGQGLAGGKGKSRGRKRAERKKKEE